MAAKVPSFSELIAATMRSAVHLEMRDEYTPDDPRYLDWKAGKTSDIAGPWRDWYDVVRANVARGVEFRRLRIISEPITDSIRYEYELTGPLNLVAGERVRWLPRRRASDLALPGNDFWVFDDRLVRWGHFAGDGTFIANEVAEDPVVVRLCLTAFEAAWERAIAHEEYRPVLA